ncbi:MAG: hypothetical protein ACYCSZ_13960 [Burkholderiales bacterium]
MFLYKRIKKYCCFNGICLIINKSILVTPMGSSRRWGQISQSYISIKDRRWGQISQSYISIKKCWIVRSDPNGRDPNGTRMARLRIAMICSTITNEWQRHGKRRIRLDLLNGIHITVFTTVADDSRTMLLCRLSTTRTIDVSVISTPPRTFYRKSVSLPTPEPRSETWNALK